MKQTDQSEVTEVKCLNCENNITRKYRLSYESYKKSKFCNHKCFGQFTTQSEEQIKESFFNRTLVLKNGCIEWIGGKCAKGYGMARYNGRTIRSHRLAYFFKTGIFIDEKFLACHKCDNPSCVNADHIFIGTNKDNCQDKINKGRARYHKGEQSNSAKLTEEKVIFILNSKKPATKLSIELGVSQSAIRAIRQGKNWNHIKRDL